jgi:hypothetical protein
MASKMLRLRDNRLKSSTSVEFFNQTYKNKKELCIIYKNCQNFAPLFNVHKIQGIQLIIIFTFLLIISQTKRF